MSERLNHQLNIGDSVLIKHQLISRIDLLYAGIPNDQTFSLVVIHKHGHQAMAYNLYIPLDQRHLTIAGVPIAIHSVSPATIQLSTD